MFDGTWRIDKAEYKPAGIILLESIKTLMRQQTLSVVDITELR